MEGGSLFLFPHDHVHLCGITAQEREHAVYATTLNTFCQSTCAALLAPPVFLLLLTIPCSSFCSSETTFAETLPLLSSRQKASKAGKYFFCAKLVLLHADYPSTLRPAKVHEPQSSWALIDYASPHFLSIIDALKAKTINAPTSP